MMITNSWNGKDIKYLSNLELIQAYNDCIRAEDKREIAKNHSKFKKMELPPINPQFLNIKNNLFNEIKNRKLDISQ